jgi:hypothetical protein
MKPRKKEFLGHTKINKAEVLDKLKNCLIKI